MRKLYHHNKHKIHPSPPPSTADPTYHLSLLPIAIATLAAALAPEDKEVLAYLLSCSLTTTAATDKNNKNLSGNTKPTRKFIVGDAGGGGNHPPLFSCNCFACYTSYWVRWDASPNRQLIHEIIDAYEDELINTQKKNGLSKKDKKKKKVSTSTSPSSSSSSPHAPPASLVKGSHAPPQEEEMMINGVDEDVDQDELTMGSSSSSPSEKGPVRKFVSFIGERIWGVWGV